MQYLAGYCFCVVRLMALFSVNKTEHMLMTFVCGEAHKKARNRCKAQL